MAGHASLLALPQDATFEMERRRNRPEKYDRQLVHKTVKAMQKVDEVRSAGHRGITNNARCLARRAPHSAYCLPCNTLCIQTSTYAVIRCA